MSVVPTFMKNVIAFGNPLLDITVTGKEDVAQLLSKYNLKIDGQIEFSQQEMVALNDDIAGLNKYVSPGGCSQNSLRVMQWMLRGQAKAIIFGSVGRDRDADKLKESVEKEGVMTRYLVHESKPTGKTIALIQGENRSLVAHIGAAGEFPLDSLKLHPKFQIDFQESNLVLVEAFFLTNRFETANYIVEMCKTYQKTLIFNLCGEYIFQIIPKEIEHLVKSANIIFGNMQEFNALTNLLKFTSLEGMATSLGKSQKILVITDGAQPVTCHSSSGMFQVDPLMLLEIKDTTAAGDAFVGGFLAGLALSKRLDECVKLGCYASKCIIQEDGCSIPQYLPDISL